ncbi:MAG: class I SAM-dependent methyltransferase [Capsulimonadales bacterium]|nr:class I SAM-dependent methyltransferase [Capsulimonadales bacterium]
MGSADDSEPIFAPDAFAGTATYYARYRVPYPRPLVQDLVRRAGITGNGSLLDLACGPGRVALALAEHFREILAIDLEPEMVAVGKEEAVRQGIRHVRWQVGKAEELNSSPARFELVTIGEAFHRLDRKLVAEKTLLWLQPGCCVSVMGARSRASDWEPWQHIVANLTRKRIGRAVSTGGVSPLPVPGGETEEVERTLRQSGFEAVESYTFAEPYNWTVETILGNLFSLSVCSRRVLGRDADDFAEELTAALMAYDPAGQYHETVHFGYTLGRKPA